MTMTKTNLQFTDLEMGAIEHFLKRNHIDKEFFGRDFEGIKVTKRRMTGEGFFTDLSTTKSLEEVGVKSLRWSKTRATLNNNLDVGFLIYVDDGMLSTIEGYTYGDTAWPEVITSFEIRELGKNEF